MHCHGHIVQFRLLVFQPFLTHQGKSSNSVRQAGLKTEDHGNALCRDFNAQEQSNGNVSSSEVPVGEIDSVVESFPVLKPHFQTSHILPALPRRQILGVLDGFFCDEPRDDVVVLKVLEELDTASSL